MVMSNGEFQEIIAKLSESKLNKLKQYAIELLNEDEEKLNEGLDFFLQTTIKP